MATHDQTDHATQGEPSMPRVPSALVEVLLLGESFPPKQPAPMVDLSSIWVAARSRWRIENGGGDVGPEND